MHNERAAARLRCALFRAHYIIGFERILQDKPKISNPLIPFISALEVTLKCIGRSTLVHKGLYLRKHVRFQQTGMSTCLRAF